MSNVINGFDYLEMVRFGTLSLIRDIDRVNSLNVFPVPDGDTGTNMRMTIEGGLNEVEKLNEPSIGVLSKKLARNMVLYARGNSGVILSQFFKGISNELQDKDEATVLDFANALISGTKRSYSVVQNPTEGTMLTVMREAGENAIKEYNDSLSLAEYLDIYIKYAKESLDNTPNLLPVLKKAGVIDSGGYGLVLILEGMQKAANGESIEQFELVEENGFDENSKLSYGYKLYVTLQLLSSKINIPRFDTNIILETLNSNGNNAEMAKEGTKIIASVNTFDPGVLLTELRKYGEFIDIKIINMDIDKDITPEIQEVEVKERKKYATIAVANGVGLVNAFKEMGTDEVVSGGQTMNTSTQDFIKAFDRVNAENIIVFPNNGNILLAANQAKEIYTKSNIYVMPTKTIAQGYSAQSMINYESDNIDEILSEINQAIENVSTLEVTYSIRDCTINNIPISKGDYICLYNNELIASDKDRISAIKKAFRNIPDFENKEVLTVLKGREVPTQECDELKGIAEAFNSYMEVYLVEGGQDIYSYIIGIE